MPTEAKTPYLTRESVLKDLSDEEVASVSTAEATSHLSNGDEYLDLDHLEKGIRRDQGHVLPKKAVHEQTWRKIMGQLKGS